MQGSRTIRRWPLVGVGFLLVIACMGLNAEFRQRQLLYRLDTWPSGNAVVLESRVIEKLDVAAPQYIVSIPELRCELTVDGRRIETIPQLTGYGSPASIVAGSQPGETVVLRYDPTNPKRTIYDQGGVHLENDNSWWIAGVLFGAAALVVRAFWPRRRADAGVDESDLS